MPYKTDTARKVSYICLKWLYISRKKVILCTELQFNFRVSYMSKLLDKIKPKTDFSKNVFSLMTGVGIAQVITFLAAPILSRIFEKSDFGILASFQGIVAILSIFVSAKYEQIIVIPKEEKDAVNLVALSFFIMVVVSVLLLAIVLVSPHAFDIMMRGDISSWLIYVPFTVFLVGAVQILNSYFIRHKYYKQTGNSLMAQNLTRVSTNIGVGVFTNISGGLIYGHIAGQIATIGVLLIHSFKKLKSELKTYFSWSHCAAMIKKYKSLALTLLPANLLGAIGINMTPILLVFFFDTSVAGLYHICFIIINTPIYIIGKSLSDVSYKHTMDIIHSDNSLSEYVERIIAKLLLISILPILVLLFFAPVLFDFVLGAEWRISGVYTQIMLPYFFFRFLSYPIMLFAQKNKADLFFYWQVLLLTLNLLALVAGGLLFKSSMTTVILLSISNSICYMVLLLLNFKISGAKLKNVFTKRVKN